MSCYCCSNNLQTDVPRACPECNYVFKGKGWEGLDAHWKANHSSVMTYSELWNSLCDEHRHFHYDNESDLKPSATKTNTFQRVGSKSNAHVGRDFELAAMSFFNSMGLHLKKDFKVPVGLNGKEKFHAFDLGCETQKVIVECKSHRWTTGNNVPSAKMTVWNEAMFYFLVAPPTYRKMMFVLKDYSEKRCETLGQYYLRTYSHLIPKAVELWEFDEELLLARQIN